MKVALHHPVIGVGVGGFKRAYADLAHLKGKEPKAAASHTTPITVAAENGLPGLLLFVWLARDRAAARLPEARPRLRRQRPSCVRTSLGRDRSCTASSTTRSSRTRPSGVSSRWSLSARAPSKGSSPRDRRRQAGARARAAHRRRRVRLRRDDGAPRRGRRRRALRRVLDRDALAAGGLRAGHARARGARGDRRDRDPRRRT